MPYIQYKPTDDLGDHIDAYWVRKTTSGQGSSGRRVYADGCADIVVNTGSSTAWFNPMARADDIIPLHPGCMYLGGTMTEYGVVTAAAGCILTGIRFRPGGFYAFYQQPMAPAVDSLLPFAEPVLQSILTQEDGLPSRLDAYFRTFPRTRSGKTQHDFTSIYKIIHLSKGQISVEALSKECHMSRRTMERVFKENIGIPPKEFIRIVRFQEVLRRLRETDVATVSTPTRPPRESLLRIAFELGYHDHAHLTNEFKLYAGILPSELSRFYKTGIALGQYF